MKNNDILSSIEIIHPKYASVTNVEKIKDLKIFYEETILENIIISEYILWCKKWKSEIKNQLKFYQF